MVSKIVISVTCFFFILELHKIGNQLKIFERLNWIVDRHVTKFSRLIISENQPCKIQLVNEYKPEEMKVIYILDGIKATPLQ